VTVTLRAENIRKSFSNRPVLRGISLDLTPGSFTVLAGGNGAGKTTFLKIIAKLMKPDDGNISINGEDIWTESDKVRRNVGFLSHQIYLYEDLNALENLRFTARLFGLRDYNDRIEHLLKELHLYHRQYDPIKTYSRGMQQRLSLARALLHDPDILLLDEPFSGLDEAGIETFLAFIQEYKAQQKSAVIVSHNLQMGYELADDLYILFKGDIGYHSKKSQVTFNEYHAEFRRLLEESG
jgi:heme ABC exporter ATP-binding subunit CcmA